MGKHQSYFEEMRDAVAGHAWDMWTEDGSIDDNAQTAKSALDAATNTYHDGIDIAEWCEATLRLLGYKTA